MLTDDSIDHSSSSPGAMLNPSGKTDLPEITVIVPVYNGASYLHRCLESITTSTYGSYSCIVVNDGSTDESAIIAAQFHTRVLQLAEGPFGPAYARNRGAAAARGSILFFVDCDVALAPGSLEQVAEIFRRDPGIDAIFGSYDAAPEAPEFISQYRNLLHHFVHQNGRIDASTFWAGCGAIRTDVFRQIGGFDEKTFPRPSIEDIELGYRLRRAEHRILLIRSLQGKHLKRWSFCSLIRNDIARRALPWSRLVIETEHMPNDLNLSRRQRFSAVLVLLAAACIALSCLRPVLLPVAGASELTVIILNRDLYGFFARQRGIRFAVGCVLLHFVYYLSSALSYLFVWTALKLRRISSGYKPAAESF
jgi:GT2 family glycosyltransferase